MAPCLPASFLPPTLLLVLLVLASGVLQAETQCLTGPSAVLPDAKYYPEDEHLAQQHLDVQRRLMNTAVTGVRKLSADPSEKFYLDYWGFAEAAEDTDASLLSDGNGTWSYSPEAPVRQLSGGHARLPLGWHLFAKRDFQCPSGTTACTAIDRPNSCCAVGMTCQLVQDTGLGDVGCCPSGQLCADSVSECGQGYRACPSNPGGGCCIPGYVCFEEGCAQTGTATVTSRPTPSTTTVTLYTTVTPPVAIPTSSAPSTTTSPTNTPSIPPQVLTITRTVTVPPSTSNPLTCSSGYRSCPTSLGGGCCPTDRQCGSANCPPSTVSSATAEPPVRPTSLTTVVETTTAATSTPTSTSGPVSGCPTGFYACSAVYQGGCCQIGRDCDSTSCPSGARTTLVSGSSLTIVAPTGSGITAPASSLTGACAHGWLSCPPDLGGGCCPGGYQCGVASCAATASGGGGSNVGKSAPNAASRHLSADLYVLAVANIFVFLVRVEFI